MVKEWRRLPYGPGTMTFVFVFLLPESSLLQPKPRRTKLTPGNYRPLFHPWKRLWGNGGTSRGRLRLSAGERERGLRPDGPDREEIG